MSLETEVAPAATGERISVLAWSGLESACRQVLSLLFFFATIRFISPSDLGTFSLGVALTGIVAIFIDEPVGEALVQQDTITESDWNTGYTVNLLIAVVCLAGAAVVGPVLAYVLNHPSLMLVVPALAVSSLAGAAGNIHKAYLSRSLRFRTIAQIALTAQIIGGILSLTAAAAGLGYWALVLSVLAAAIATTTMYRLSTPWRPRLRIDPSIVRKRASYAGYSIAIRALYLLRDQSLFVVAGSLGDLRTVGYLSLAMRVTRTLGLLFEEVTSRPLISLISRRQNDLAQFGQLLQTVLQIVGVIAFPSFIGLAELAGPAISLLLGTQWIPAAHYVPWICAGFGGWLFLHIVAVALRSHGLGRSAVWVTALPILLDACIFASATLIGIDWALKLWAVRAVVSVPLLAAVLSTRLGVPFRQLCRIWAPPAAASLIMFVALRWFEGFPIFRLGAPGLLASFAAGAAVYVAALFLLTPHATRTRLLLQVHGR